MNNGNDKLLTIYLTTYNRKDYIKEAINGVLGQTFRNFNLVVLDNASTDGTSEIIDSYDDPRLFHIRRKENVGPIANCNTAFEMVDSKYFIITHDDDIMLPTMVEKQIKFMEKNPDVAISDVGIILINKNGKSTSNVNEQIANSDYSFDIFNEDEFFISYYSGGSPMSCPTVMFRTEFINKNRICLRNEVGTTNDQCLYCEINLNGGKILRIREKLYLYRVHGKQDSFNAENRVALLENALYDILLSKKKTHLSKYLAGGVNRKIVSWSILKARKLLSSDIYAEACSYAKQLDYYEKPNIKQRLIMFIANRFPACIRFGYFLIRKVFNRQSDYMKILHTN